MEMGQQTLFFVINTLHKGGAERVLSLLSNNFDRRNFKVFIACLNYEKESYPISEGVQVCYLLKVKRKNFFLYRIGYALITYTRLLNLLISKKPQCVVAFMTTANLWAGLCCSVLKVPYIVSERTTPDLTIRKFNFLLRWLTYRIYKNSKAVVSPAHGVEDCLKNIDPFDRLDNYRVINNPVSVLRESKAIIVHPRRFILAVGRLIPEKGFDMLIDAFKMVSDEDVDLIIVGQGPDRELLQGQIDRLDLRHRILLTGVKDDLSSYYRQAEIFVLSSRIEGYPNVLIEAMSMGCSCIAMNCNFGPSEIIDHGVNGLLVDAHDYARLTETMEVLLANSTLRRILSQNAQQIKTTNSLESITDKWEQLILCDI